MKKIIFDSFKPNKILISIEKINSDEDDLVSASRLQLYIKKIINRQKLKENKLRKIFLRIDEVDNFIKDTQKKDTFYKNLIILFSNISLVNIEKWMFAIKHILFSTYKRTNYHNLLKNNFSKKIKKDIIFSSLENQYIYKYIFNNSELEKFYGDSVYNLFIESKQDIEMIYEELGISKTLPLYHSSIYCLIENNILNIIIKKKSLLYSKEFKKIMKGSFSIKEKSLIFKIILNYYADNESKISPKNYNYFWFEYILKENGDLSQEKWWQYSEIEKSIFKKWLNFKNIKHFFEKHIEDSERKNYWYTWMKLIEETEIIEEFNLALIMKFKNHLIVEFGEVGAVRIYENRVLSIKGIESTFNNYPKTRAKEMIRDNYKDIRWNHHGDWKFKFDSNMWNFGYKR